MTSTTRPRRRLPLAATALTSLALLLGACAGDPITPGSGPGGSSGSGSGSTGSDPLPTTDDVLGLPEDAFDSIEWTPEGTDDLGTLDVEGVVRLEAEIDSDAPVHTVYPSLMRVYYSSDEEEFGELQEVEWVVGTADAGSTSWYGFMSADGPAGGTITQPPSLDVDDAVLADWVVTASEAAGTAVAHSPGQIEQIRVPDGADRPLVTVVTIDGSQRTRVTVDAVTGEALNAVVIP